MIFLPAKKGYLPDFVIAYSEMNRSVLRSILDAPDFPAAATTQVRIFGVLFLPLSLFSY